MSNPPGSLDVARGPWNDGAGATVQAFRRQRDSSTSMEDSAAETARVKLLTLLNVAATRRHRDGTAGRKRKDRPEADENAQPEARDWRVIARSAASKVDQEQFPRKLDAVATASTSPDLKSRSLVHDGATKDDAGAGKSSLSWTDDLAE